MLWRRLQKIIFCLALAPAGISGGAAAANERPLVEMNYTSLGELASRYCEVFKCEVDLPPSVMSYPIIVPFYSSESKTYLEAQLRAVAFEKNYSCKLGEKKISCIEKKKSIPLIDSSDNRWKILRVENDELQLTNKIILHNQGITDYFSPDSFYLDSSKLLPLKPSNYLYTIKVLITITEFDLGYKIVKASYINDFYSSDFSGKFLKYGSTVRELNSSQVAENGTRTDSFNDKLQGLQIDTNNVITITANNRDLNTYLFGGLQELLQVRKECRFNLFGFELFCGLVQTSILISLE